MIVEIDEINNIAFKNLLVAEPSPPDLYITTQGDNIVLNWTMKDTTGVSHYLIHRSTSQVDFDFSNPWVQTHVDSDNGNISLRTTWNDTDSASPLAEREYYYNIQAVYTFGEISPTSRTVGKFTRIFQKGISTFSLPLEPFVIQDSEFYATVMDANYIKWMDPSNHTWVKHDKGSITNNTQIVIGKGYEIEFGSQTHYTFLGMPGAMIRFNNISFGFDAKSGGRARSLDALVNKVSNTVTLDWMGAENMGPQDNYHVLRSSKRDGFWGTPGVNYEELAVLPNGTLSYLDNVTTASSTEYYYMIVPVNGSSLEWGKSSYSIGVWTTSDFVIYDTFGLPLKLKMSHNAHWFCNEINNSVGINYFNIASQLWQWHSTLMSSGAYDPVIEIGVGYQISVFASTKYSFVGI
jgi:hypothetical protein